MGNGKLVYSQLLDFLDRNHFNYLVRKYEGEIPPASVLPPEAARFRPPAAVAISWPPGGSGQSDSDSCRPGGPCWLFPSATPRKRAFDGAHTENSRLLEQSAVGSFCGESEKCKSYKTFRKAL